MGGEIFGYAMEKLFESGALDVFYTPIYMKKNRPAVKLTVICDINNIKKIQDVIFSQTTTIGIRKYPVERECLERSIEKIETEYGSIEVKKCRYGKSTRYIPEYEECKKIAERLNKPLYNIYNEIYKNINS